MTAAIPINQMLTIGQLAAQLGVHEQTIRAWERQGLIPPPLRFRGRRRYTLADAERIRAAVLTSPTEGAAR